MQPTDSTRRQRNEPVPYPNRGKQYHAVLPTGWKKADVVRELPSLLRTLKLPGTSKLTSTDIIVLGRIMKKTKAAHYYDTERSPVCYERQGTMAASIGLCDRHWRRLETKLEEKGLIARETAANGRRGRVITGSGAESRSGLSLEPLIERIEELETLRQRRIEEEETLVLTRLEISKARRRLKTCEGDLGDDCLADELREARAAWTAPSRIKSLEQAKAHLRDLEALEDRALAIIGQRSSMSGAADADDRCHIQDKNRENKYGRAGETPAPRTRDVQTTRTSSPQNTDAPCQELTFEELRDIASDDLGFCLDTLCNGGRWTADIFDRAIGMRCPDLGIHASTYEKAKGVMGHRLAMLSVIVIDRNRTHPTTPTKCCPAVLNDFVKLFPKGELNLWRSVQGIRSRTLQHREVVCLAK